MTSGSHNPVLAGNKALVIGIANEHSIAYGCAKAFEEQGAEVAVTYLNDKARPYVEPLARELGAELVDETASPASCAAFRLSLREAFEYLP